MPALAKLGFNAETGSPRFVPALAKLGFNGETGSSRICATTGTAWLQWGRDRVSGFASRLHAEGEPKDGLHPQHGTPKPCRVRRQRLRREIIASAACWHSSG